MTARDDTLADEIAAAGGAFQRGPQNAPPPDFGVMVLENLRAAGVHQKDKADAIKFSSLEPWPGEWIAAEGRYADEGGRERRAGIFIGPEFGTVTRADLTAAAREASEARFDVLIACAFSYDAHASELSRLGPLAILKARMNPDLHMAEELKTTSKGNLFVVFGEPDITVVGGPWLVARSGKMVVSYNELAELPGLGSLDTLNRLGGSDLPGLKRLARNVDVGWAKRSVPTHASANEAEPRGHGGSPAVAHPTALTAFEALTPSDFPLSLTTDHWLQVTVHGIDVFDPATGEIRSDDTKGIACWFIDTDYNEESFFVRQAYFLGANEPYKSLKTALKAEIDPDAWETLYRDTSRPFARPETGRIAVKVINHFGDEVLKVLGV